MQKPPKDEKSNVIWTNRQTGGRPTDGQTRKDKTRQTRQEKDHPGCDPACALISVTFVLPVPGKAPRTRSPAQPHATITAFHSALIHGSYFY